MLEATRNCTAIALHLGGRTPCEGGRSPLHRYGVPASPAGVVSTCDAQQRPFLGLVKRKTPGGEAEGFPQMIDALKDAIRGLHHTAAPLIEQAQSCV